LARDITWPVDIHPLVAAFVDNLLQLDPRNRLGASTQKDFATLKAHPYFAEIDFNAIMNTSPPIELEAADEDLFND
jgi:hypothetical protein